MTRPRASPCPGHPAPNGRKGEESGLAARTGRATASPPARPLRYCAWFLPAPRAHARIPRLRRAAHPRQSEVDRQDHGVTRQVERVGRSDAAARNHVKEACRDRGRTDAAAEITRDTTVSALAELWLSEIRVAVANGGSLAWDGTVLPRSLGRPDPSNLGLATSPRGDRFARGPAASQGPGQAWRRGGQGCPDGDVRHVRVGGTA